MNRFGKGEERGKEKSLSLTQCEKLLVIKPSPTIIASVCLLPSPTITTSVDLMLLGMECSWNERQAERGTWERDSEIFREEKWSEQKPSNGNITWFLNWFDNTQVMGPTIKIQTHQQLSTKTTASTKKSEWIKNPNPPTAFNQNHNLRQKIQANKLHHSPSLKPPQPQQKNQTQIFRLETQITKIWN